MKLGLLVTLIVEEVVTKQNAKENKFREKKKRKDSGGKKRQSINFKPNSIKNKTE